jgi:hypothetical protein
MESKKKEATRKEHGSINVKKIGAGAGILITVFLLGYVPSCVSARNAREQNARLDYELKLAELRGGLGMASYEANRNNFANAAQFATVFFNGLREAIDNTKDEAMKQKFESILARRDEITSNLAQTDPAIKEKLAEMYAAFFQITGPSVPKK